MTRTLTSAAAVLTDAVASVRAGIDSLLTVDVDAVAGMELAATVQALEVEVRRLNAVDARLLAELDSRGLAGEFGACSTVDLLRDRLRIPARRAAARLAAAHDTGPRRALTGEPLPPVYARLAEAQAAGTVDAEAARLIRRCLDGLPGDLAFTRGPDAEAEVEAVLVDAASRVDARALAAVIERVRAHLDPDGEEPREHEIRARRCVDLTTRADGTGALHGELTREATAALAAVLDPLCAPDPADDGMPDPRTAAQRRHDGLLDACTRLLRSGTLPDAGGVPATILLSVDAADLVPTLCPQPTTGRADTGSDQGLPAGRADGRQSGSVEGFRAGPVAACEPPAAGRVAGRRAGSVEGFRAGPVAGREPLAAGFRAGSVAGCEPHAAGRYAGVALTAAGGLLPLLAALRLADQAEIYTVLRNPAGGILAATSARRLATPAQRRALSARDRGCSFPGCTRPPAWCEAHHVTAWIDGGSTTVDNMTLVCGFHHREFERLGWTCRMHHADRVPEWIPPPHLDPKRKPRRNTAHDILRF